MNNNKKVNAAILIIGNEILSGRTQDTNTSTIALWLNSLGAYIYGYSLQPQEELNLFSNIKNVLV